jgi:CRISPR-associated endonuclease/helicase Cas3
MASDFASAFEAGRWGYLAGLWHDLGKYQEDFQEHLHKGWPTLDHSAFGALLAKKTFNDDHRALPLSFVIAGHHTGLANLRQRENQHRPSLVEHLRAHQNNYQDLFIQIPEELLRQTLPQLPDYLQTSPGMPVRAFMKARRSLEFWTRFLFSALVDADRLDREAFLTPHAEIPLPGAAMPELHSSLSRYLNGLTTGLPVEPRETPLRRLRGKVLSACREAAGRPPGLFVLNVPGGWGKSLASLAFATDHALAHGLRRVVLVLPHSSLIEQSALTCREAYGSENVLEHYTGFDPPAHADRFTMEWDQRRDMAAENWDKPIIVTDTIQFFESLYANSADRCRKLHNLSGSAIILDQVHALPPGTLICITEALQELVRHYRCSVLLSTTPPPALTARPAFPEGLTGVSPIMIEAERQRAEQAQADYSWPDPDLPGPTWSQLAAELAGHDQVLTIVPRHGDARMLARLLREISGRKSVYHLSGLMCPAHRSEIVNQVRTALNQGAPYRLVASRLVETCSDLDFPVVYLALGGLESMAQAGSLCNRSGQLEKGLIRVFMAPSRPPRGIQSKAFEVARALLQAYDGHLDLNDPKLFEAYYRTLYYNEEQDACSIQPLRQEFNFADVQRHFKLIEDGFTRTVVAPYGKAPELLAAIAAQGPSRRIFRELQPYTIQVHEQTFSQIREAGAILELTPGLFSVNPAFNYIYDQDFGLAAADDPRDHPDTLIA